ncbi:hypothetical protein ACQUSR_18905 [Streptomyces sp. P1-3]|uniref:hypothetical protein n=1 Tax=Streptomyces sp. P1-3 TaxID=3421658 RepID=UPI003D36D549
MADPTTPPPPPNVQPQTGGSTDLTTTEDLFGRHADDLAAQIRDHLARGEARK